MVIRDNLEFLKATYFVDTLTRNISRQDVQAYFIQNKMAAFRLLQKISRKNLISPCIRPLFTQSRLGEYYSLMSKRRNELLVVY